MWMAGWCRVEGRAGHSGICGAPHPPACDLFHFATLKGKTAVTEDKLIAAIESTMEAAHREVGCAANGMFNDDCLGFNDVLIWAFSGIRANCRSHSVKQNLWVICGHAILDIGESLQR
jgi:hypothetical protein